MRKKKIANYTGSANYLDYLTALRKFFTNDQDMIPIIYGFNFYVNGVYGIPFLDLFRSYEDNYQDIHGDEKTKALTDDGTIGVINEMIYKSGNGSLIASLEALRLWLIDRTKTYTVVYNPFFNAYTEAELPKINNLGNDYPEVTTSGEGAIVGTDNPVVNTTGGNTEVLSGGLGGPGGGPNGGNVLPPPVGGTEVRSGGLGGPGGGPNGGSPPPPVGGTKVSLPPKKKKKSIWSYLTWAVYKPKPKPYNTGNGGYL